VRLLIAAVASACLSLVVVLASRAADQAVGLLAVMAAIAAVATVCARAGRGGLAVVDPLWTLILLLRGGVDVWSLLPLWAAQAVGALAAGFGAGRLIEDLPVLELVQEPPAVTLAVLCALGGLLAGWLVVAAEGRWAPVAVVALPSAVAVVAVPVWATGASAMGPLFAAGVAGVTAWSDVFVAALALAAGGVAGSLTAGLTASPDA